jgi:hypothetical protein
MKLIGRDDRGNPIWRPDDWEEPKEEKKTEPQEQKATRIKLEKVK